MVVNSKHRFKFCTCGENCLKLTNDKYSLQKQEKWNKWGLSILLCDVEKVQRSKKSPFYFIFSFIRLMILLNIKRVILPY
jgi:hypothetical protein